MEIEYGLRLIRCGHVGSFLGFKFGFVGLKARHARRAYHAGNEVARISRREAAYHAGDEVARISRAVRHISLDTKGKTRCPSGTICLTARYAFGVRCPLRGRVGLRPINSNLSILGTLQANQMRHARYALSLLHAVGTHHSPRGHEQNTVQLTSTQHGQQVYA